MEEKETIIKDIDMVKLEALRKLPADILETFTKMEVRAFLYKDEWPDSLREKLANYLQ